MADIKTKINVGDEVWWVHEGIQVRKYKGTVVDISLCEYQGALYCVIHSPTFKINPNPCVHYSEVFKTKEEAEKFRKNIKNLKDRNFEPEDGFKFHVYPMCFGCYHYWKGETNERND